MYSSEFNGLHFAEKCSHLLRRHADRRLTFSLPTEYYRIDLGFDWSTSGLKCSPRRSKENLRIVEAWVNWYTKSCRGWWRRRGRRRRGCVEVVCLPRTISTFRKLEEYIFNTGQSMLSGCQTSSFNRMISASRSFICSLSRRRSASRSGSGGCVISRSSRRLSFRRCFSLAARSSSSLLRT